MYVRSIINVCLKLKTSYLSTTKQACTWIDELGIQLVLIDDELASNWTCTCPGTILVREQTRPVQGLYSFGIARVLARGTAYLYLFGLDHVLPAVLAWAPRTSHGVRTSRQLCSRGSEQNCDTCFFFFDVKLRHVLIDGVLCGMIFSFANVSL
jgi:hypothetical protein